MIIIILSITIMIIIMIIITIPKKPNSHNFCVKPRR